MHFGSYLPFLDFCVKKTKRFVVRFRHILEAFQFGIWKLCKIDKKVVGAFSRFTCCANKHSWLQRFVKMLWPGFIILHAHKLCWVVRTHCEVLDFHILWECFESEHIWTASTPTNCDLLVLLYAKHFQESLGLAPQTCFVISELQKKEQILWNLTWGKMPGKIKQVVHRGL